MIRSPLLRLLLFPLAWLYWLGVRCRSTAYERGWCKTHRLRTPVISVGNLTVGGTGKTPCVAYLAQLLRDAGHEVAILSRGYKRTSKGRVEVSNGREILCSPQEAGDEPYLLARACPGVRVIVDQDRYAAGRWLEEHASVSVFLLDDGYQHLRLARAVNVLLVDATDPLQTAQMVPFGRLREPLAALRRADVVIVTRADQPYDHAALNALLKAHSFVGGEAYQSWYEITGLRRLDADETRSLSALAEQPVAAFCGIANPDQFFHTVARFAPQIVLRRDFADHHAYTHTELADVVAAARAAGAALLLTTEKDAVKLPSEFLAAPGLPLYALQIAFVCAQEERLKERLWQALPARDPK